GWAPCTGRPAEAPPSGPEDELDWGVSPNEGVEADVGFAPRCLAFAPASSLLAAGGAGLALFDPLVSRCKQIGRAGAAVSAVAFAPDGRELVAGTESGLVELWDAGTGRLLRTSDGGCGPISAAAIALDGATCAAGTETGRIVVWDRDGD